MHFPFHHKYMPPPPRGFSRRITEVEMYSNDIFSFSSHRVQQNVRSHFIIVQHAAAGRVYVHRGNIACICISRIHSGM